MKFAAFMRIFIAGDTQIIRQIKHRTLGTFYYWIFFSKNFQIMKFLLLFLGLTVASEPSRFSSRKVKHIPSEIQSEKEKSESD
jgi:hypothetical protein